MKSIAFAWVYYRAAYASKDQKNDVYLYVMIWNLFLIALGVQLPHAYASGQAV